MSNQRMFRYDITVLRQPTGSTQLVPAGGSTLECYLQGATVNGGQTIPVAASAITVFDVGAIKAGDTIIVADDATKTRTVASVAANTINVDAGAEIVLDDQDRLVPTTVRPYIYSDVTGGTQVDSGNVGRAPATGSTSGASEFYSRTRVLDVVASGGGLAATVVLEDQVGDMQGFDGLHIEDWGGGEANTVVADYNNAPVMTGAIAYADLTSTQPIKLGGGTYKFGSTITTTGTTVIRGAGEDLTTLTFTGSTGPLFDATAGTLVLEDLTITRSAGTAALVEADSASAKLVMRRCKISTGGIKDAGLNSILEDVTITGCSTTFLEVNGASGGLYRRVKTQPTQAATYQVQVTGSSANCVFEDCSVPLANAIGVNIPAVTVDNANCSDINFRGGSYSGNTTADGFVLTAGSGLSINGASIRTCLRGVEIGASSPAGIQLSNLQISKCNQEAVYVGGGSNISIRNLQCSSLSRESSTTYSAVNIDQTVTGIIIDGVQLGNWAGGSNKVAYVVESDAIASGTDCFIRNVWADTTYVNTDILSVPNIANPNVFVAHNAPNSVTASESTSTHEGFAYRAKSVAAATTYTVGGFGLLNITSGGATSTTTLSDGKDGQVLIIRNDSGATQTLKEMSTTGVNINGIAGDISLPDNSMVVGVFAGGRWNQICAVVSD